jgi:hypothetical protein
MNRIGFSKRLTGLASLTILIAVLTLLLRVSPASAANCLKDNYGKNVQCSANDVSIASATNIRGLDGKSLATCQLNTTFSFIADFKVVTTASARENIGLYFQTAGGSSALTGTCSDNIISPPHSCTSSPGVNCGSAQYLEADPAPDNCGDTTSADKFLLNGVSTAGQLITVEVDNALCVPAAGTNKVSLPNCTSWQQVGGTNLCQSPSPLFPFPAPPAANPGSPSKCKCDNGFTLDITVQSASLSVTKTPDKTSMPDPGGPMNYTVVTTNSSNFGNVTVNQICDDQYGNIATALTTPAQPACPAGKIGSATKQSCSPSLPATLAGPSGGNPGQSVTCTFTGNVPETGETNIVTVNGADNTNKPISGTANASVTVTEAEAAAADIKTSASAMPTSGCATVRYSVEVDNTSGVTTDEMETLSALTDSQYGDITAVQGNVQGTTCGATGLGTLSGSAGAGVLPLTIPVAGKYACQFDAKVCGTTKALSTSATPPNLTNCPAGLEVSDSVSGTLVGDESEMVSQTPGTLTVDVCFATTETSK